MGATAGLVRAKVNCKDRFPSHLVRLPYSAALPLSRTIAASLKGLLHGQFGFTRNAR